MSWFLKKWVLHLILVSIFNHLGPGQHWRNQVPPVCSVCTLADMEQVLGRRTRLDVNDWAAGLAKTVDVESLLKYFNLLRIP